MASLFNLYWNSVGRTVSGIKGSIADFFPLPLVEILVWVGILFTLISLNNLRVKIGIMRGKYAVEVGATKSSALFSFLMGPFLLFLLLSGQRVIPLSPAPTALRPPLQKHFNASFMFEPEFDSLFVLESGLLSSTFPKEEYRKMNYQNLFADCNEMLDTVIKALGFSAGRKVGNIKAMVGLTRILGTSYGGPAYHDPLTSEVAWISHKDFPTTNAWRIHAACHEIAHAKGFTREADAEVLTYLGLAQSDNPLYQSMARLLWLQKSGRQFDLPEYLELEQRLRRDERKKVKLKQPLVRMADKITDLLGIKNSPAKYGNQKKGAAWNPSNPFFATVHHLNKTIFSPPIPSE